MAARNQQAGRGGASAAGAGTQEEARRRRPRHEVEAIHERLPVLAQRRADGILISLSIF
jgi:hypothetical protein